MCYSKQKLQVLLNYSSEDKTDRMAEENFHNDMFTYRDISTNAKDFPPKGSFPIQAQAHSAPINKGSIPYAVLGCGHFL